MLYHAVEFLGQYIGSVVTCVYVLNDWGRETTNIYIFLLFQYIYILRPVEWQCGYLCAMQHVASYTLFWLSFLTKKVSKI
jgi:hypothetical protein